MLNVCAKAILVCYTFVSVKLNGGLDFARILLIFRCVYHEGVDTVSVAVAHLNCPGITYTTLRDNASVTRHQWGDRIQNFKVLTLLGYC
jgi:hypothetical protein